MKELRVSNPLLETARQHRLAGRLAEAAALYRQILQQNPNDPEALLGMGMVFFRAGQLEPAAQLVGRSIVLDPSSAEKYLNQSAILATMGKMDEASAAVRQALALHPQYPQAHNNLGNLLLAQHRLDEAIAAFRQAVALAPQFFEAFNNLGTTLLSKGEFQESVVYLRKAQAMRPSDADVQFSLAMALEADGQLPESQACYVRAIQLQPTSFPARVNYAVLLLTMGQRDLAWRTFFEAGESIDPLAAIYPGKRWTGTDVAGQTVLIHADNQFGDSILLARFVSLLKQRGAKIILQCRPPLASLFQSLGIEAIISLADAAPPFDSYAPLWALPHRMGFAIETIPNSVPYLSPPTDRIQRWSDRLPADGKKNIGLVWAGSESVERSRTLEIFAPLASVPNVRFVSLQKGSEASQKPPPGMEWIDWTNEISDFADTAALIQRLDLVISVDTAVAHLAGALGKSVWTLIPRRNNFFWALGGDTSPWYPTMRLFRQQTPQNWHAPIAQIEHELRQWTKK
jgi:tetratricopeptide (TPR) repeat protein